MPGMKSYQTATYITQRALLRNATGTDASVAAAITAKSVVALDPGTNGRDGAINLCLVFPTSGVTSVTVQLWVDASGNGNWCLAATQVFPSTNAMYMYQNLPADNYVVVVSAFSGSGTVGIYAQHT